MLIHLIVLLVCLLPINAHLFGSDTPNLYQKGDKVELLVNKVESDHTQLPFPYYKLPFVCPPSKTKKSLPLSIGQILSGDRVWESDYDLRFGVDQPCLRLCDLIARESGLKKADSLIRDGYVVHWLLDGLPGATTFVSFSKNSKYYASGFPLGFVKDEISYIYNHFMLVIRYHRQPQSSSSSSPSYTIVGFEVYPKSVSNEECPGASKDYKNFALNFKYSDKGELLKLRTTIPYTYSVYWREDNSIEYGSRWDLYYEGEANENHKIHWISFVNSIILLLFLSLVAAVVLLRSLKSDIESSVASPIIPVSNEFEKHSSSPTSSSGSGSWRDLLPEVFNRPPSVLLLTILVSSGVQIMVVTFGVMLIVIVNYVPLFDFRLNSSTGTLLSISLFFLITSGFTSSLSGILLFKFFNNHKFEEYYHLKLCLQLSVLFSGFLPGLLLSVTLFLNLFVWAKASSYALPFGTIIILLLLVIFVEIPLGIVGGHYGNKIVFQDSNKSSLITPAFNPALASIKPSSFNFKNLTKKSLTPAKLGIFKNWLFNPISSTLVFGVVPFGIVYVELLFILNSIWFEKTVYYYMYGFLFVTTLILIIIIAESAIIAAYIALSLYHNPNWTWLCFRIGSSIGWFIYGYSIYYFTFYLHIRDFVSVLFYFVYMALFSSVIGIGCGSVGVLSGLGFIKRIFGAVKRD